MNLGQATELDVTKVGLRQKTALSSSVQWIQIYRYVSCRRNIIISCCCCCYFVVLVVAVAAAVVVVIVVVVFVVVVVVVVVVVFYSVSRSKHLSIKRIHMVILTELIYI